MNDVFFIRFILQTSNKTFGQRSSVQFMDYVSILNKV